MRLDITQLAVNLLSADNINLGIITFKFLEYCVIFNFLDGVLPESL